MEIYRDFNSRISNDHIRVGEVIDTEVYNYFADNSIYEEENIFQLDHVAEVIGEVGLYDTIAKESKYSPWKYMGQCQKGTTENKNPSLMPLVYVCSRYRGKSYDEVLENIQMAKHACRLVMEKGFIPIAPHLYFTKLLNDDNPFERDFGMAAGKKLMQYCKSFYVLTIDDVVSEGMDEEIKYMTEILGLEGESINYTKDEANEILRQRLEI